MFRAAHSHNPARYSHIVGFHPTFMLIAGGSRVPIVDDFPKGALYDLFNTKPDEIAERKRAAYFAKRAAEFAAGADEAEAAGDVG